MKEMLTINAQSSANWWKPLFASDLHKDNIVEGLSTMIQMTICGDAPHMGYLVDYYYTMIRHCS